jgi:hypothetical protein
LVSLGSVLNCLQISEGIGQGRVTANLESWGVPARDGGAVDFWCQVCVAGVILFGVVKIRDLNFSGHICTLTVWIIMILLGIGVE